MVGHKLGEFALTRKRFSFKCVSYLGFVPYKRLMDSMIQKEQVDCAVLPVLDVHMLCIMPAYLVMLLSPLEWYPNCVV